MREVIQNLLISTNIDCGNFRPDEMLEKSSTYANTLIMSIRTELQ